MVFSQKTSRGTHSYKYPFVRIIGYFLLACTLISCSHAVHNRRRIPASIAPKTADQILSDMKTGLGLTNEEKVKVRPIIEEQVRKRNEMIAKYQARDRKNGASLADQLKDLRIATEEKLQYFLTNEQMIKYEYMQEEEDQRISRVTNQKKQEGAGQENIGPRGHRSDRF
jgi:hypothetical protein